MTNKEYKERRQTLDLAIAALTENLQMGHL